jgi:hypothetical protein
MDEVNLKIRKRAISSRGRARLHTDVFDALGLSEGASIDLINPGTGKSVAVSSFADSLVEEGTIRVSGEDIDAIGLSGDGTVLVKKTPPLPERAKAFAQGAAEELSRDLKKAEKSVRGGAEIVAKKADALKKDLLKKDDL